MFSRRSEWDPADDPWHAALESARASGRRLLDLTSGNPTAVGLSWTRQALAEALTLPGIERHTPDAAGLSVARDAIATWLGARGRPAPPDRLVITAGTSESHALLSRVLCDPGDAILVPVPSYPLFEVLTHVEGLRAIPCPLRQSASGWELDVEGIADRIDETTRAVFVVHPGNPTGMRVGHGPARALARACAERGLALIADEVFADFLWDEASDAPSGLGEVADEAGCLAACLGGLSKSCGLPQLKLGWIALHGPESLVDEARQRLELVNDAYLSASTPVQLGVRALLAGGDRWRRDVSRRIAANRSAVDEASGGVLSARPGDGGWHAILEARSGTSLAAAALETLRVDGVAVQPGRILDLPDEHVVVSLITDPTVFREGLARFARRQ